MPALPTPALQRAAELELDRARRSGRPFSLLLLELTGVPRRMRRRASLSRRTIETAAQHVRPFDTVGHGDRSGRLVIVAPEADQDAASSIPARLGAALGELGVTVTGVGTSTFPDDGLLLTHLVERATSRLDVEHGPALAEVCPRPAGSVDEPNETAGGGR